MANKLKEALTKKMTVFDKLKEMSEKELYNFLTINHQPYPKSFSRKLFKELKEGNFNTVADLIYDRGGCLLCAYLVKPCGHVSCARGKEEFLLKEWEGYYNE